MSYPNITKNMQAAGLEIANATDQELEAVLWKTLEEDLPEGFAHLHKVAEKVAASNDRVIDIQDPNSSLGKQLIRLVGTDIARSLCERRLNVALGFYNCCVTVAAPTKPGLNMDIREQINLQNGILASADC